MRILVPFSSTTERPPFAFKSEVVTPLDTNAALVVTTPLWRRDFEVRLAAASLAPTVNLLAVKQNEEDAMAVRGVV